MINFCWILRYFPYLFGCYLYLINFDDFIDTLSWLFNLPLLSSHCLFDLVELHHPLLWRYLLLKITFSASSINHSASLAHAKYYGLHLKTLQQILWSYTIYFLKVLMRRVFVNLECAFYYHCLNMYSKHGVKKYYGLFHE